MVAASENCAALFDLSLPELLKRSPEQLFGGEAAAVLAGVLTQDRGLQNFSLETSSGLSLQASCFSCRPYVGLCLEHPSLADHAGRQEEPSPTELLRSITTATCLLQTIDEASEDGLEPFSNTMVNVVRTITGFDRVMLYRFDSDWNGIVIAEDRAPEVATSYLGLHFPSSDIPRAARHLFHANSVRTLVDMQRPASALQYTKAYSQAQPVDLGQCHYRDVSDVHRRYLVNMGVRSSLTFALSVNNKLWGLIACHNMDRSRQISPTQLVIFKSFSDIMSVGLSRILARQEKQALDEITRLCNWIRDQSAKSVSTNFVEVILRPIVDQLPDLIGCDGFVYISPAVLFSSDNAPSASGIEKVRCFFRDWSRHQQSSSLITARLRDYGVSLSSSDQTKAAGVIAIQNADDATKMLLFRRPRLFSSTWAGDPKHRVVRLEGGGGLDPRSSFERFVEENHHSCLEWTLADQAVAFQLFDTLSHAQFVMDRRDSFEALKIAKLEAIEATERMTHAAMHDELTGLANRRMLEIELQGSIERSLLSLDEPEAKLTALLHLDLDGFKRVNDTLGHDSGDQLLVMVANSIRGCLRREDLAARMGGDEFIVLTSCGRSKDAIEALASRLLQVLSNPIQISGKVCRISASIGIAIVNRQDNSSSSLLRRADIALYESKRKGKGCYSFYDENLDKAFNQEVQLAEEFEIGFSRSELLLYYQPLFRADSRRLVGAEALVRWNHPRMGLLAPGQFFNAVDQARMMPALDHFSLSQARDDLRRWMEQGLSLSKLSVNVSADRLLSQDLVKHVRALDFPDGVLVFELLESIYLDYPDQDLLDKIRDLQDLGVRIELDDFGTGRTSVISLMSVKPSGIKLDRGLVIPSQESQDARCLMKLVVDMGHSLGISVTAEGVENMGTAKLAHDFGCDMLQGYGLGRPMPPDHFLGFALKNHAETMA
ncbi:EAL domain-containing protein [Synechococcus sp. CBW1002]|nr:EAL domain-containing protein [Synechococcus sp. CBW1002]